MGILRSLSVLLIACGLFVQTAAYASVRPEVPIAIDSPCDEMRMMPGSIMPDDTDPAPCENMRLDCLVALGCISPLIMPARDVAPLARILAEPLFPEFAAFSLAIAGRGPEPPPPQARS